MTLTLKWKRIRGKKSRGIYLVTNNLKARDAFGRKSHVWLTDFIQRSSTPEQDGTFIIFTDFDQKVCNLTHYIEIEGL